MSDLEKLVAAIASTTPTSDVKSLLKTMLLDTAKCDCYSDKEIACALDTTCSEIVHAATRLQVLIRKTVPDATYNDLIIWLDGNISDGFQVFGPFLDWDEMSKWGEGAGGWGMSLQVPEEKP